MREHLQRERFRGGTHQRPPRLGDKPNVQTKFRRHIAGAYPNHRKESFEHLKPDVQRRVVNI